MNIKENKKGCHPEESLFRISSLLINDRKAGGPEQQHLRTTRCAAFTLIELLVVVLIIGILSAIALPQYQKAVAKARTVEARILLRRVTDAQEAYYLANNEYVNDINELGEVIPSDLIVTTPYTANSAKPNQYYFTCWANRTCGAFAYSADLPVFENMLLHDSVVAFRGRQACYAGTVSGKAKNNIATEICKSLGTPYTEAGYSGFYKIN